MNQVLDNAITGRAKISIVIPCYNERETIRNLVDTVAAQPFWERFDYEMIIVDDHSTDGSQTILEEIVAQRSEVRMVRHGTNKGKGAALQTGFNMVEGDIVVIQDADLEYDPGEYPKLFEPILSGKADVVYGSRFMGGGAAPGTVFLA